MTADGSHTRTGFITCVRRMKLAARTGCETASENTGPSGAAPIVGVNEREL
jgi:hypothetical protein